MTGLRRRFASWVSLQRSEKGVHLTIALLGKVIDDGGGCDSLSCSRWPLDEAERLHQGTLHSCNLHTHHTHSGFDFNSLAKILHKPLANSTEDIVELGGTEAA